MIKRSLPGSAEREKVLEYLNDFEDLLLQLIELEEEA